jgi:CRISPR-associated protein Csm5
MSMEFLHAWQLAITPLAPLHIGTGEDFDPTNYVIDADSLYAFSAEKAMRALPERFGAELLRIVNQRPSVEMIKQVQAFFYRYHERLIPEATQRMPVLPSIAEEYQRRVGKTAQREQTGREIINQLRIERTYADPAAQRPILPGSSLKGAVRTALLDRVNAGEGLPQQERSLRPQQQNQALQQRLFRYREFDKFEQDPMRLVQLGDALNQSATDLYATEVRYAVNRKRYPVMKNGHELLSQAENLRQVLECVPPLRPRAFLGRLTIQDPGELHSQKLPDPTLRWTLADIAAACNDFYRPIFDREREELQGRGYLDSAWSQAVDRVLGVMHEAITPNRAFLLRIGRHSGAESVTLNGVRRIKIMQGKGEKPEYLSEVKTFWLAAREIQDRRHLLPFGWVLVECAREGETFSPWPTERMAALESYSREAVSWRQRTEDRRTELRNRLTAEKAREAERQQAEKQAQEEEKARAARWAELSEEQQAIENLREQFVADRAAGHKPAGGALANRLAELLREAVTWKQAESALLAALAEQIYGFVGWGSGKKKKEKRARIEKLKGGC